MIRVVEVSIIPLVDPNPFGPAHVNPLPYVSASADIGTSTA